MDVALQVVVFHRQPVVLHLHDVADRDQTDQPAVFHHGQMADAPLGHQTHGVFDGVIGRAGGHVAGHDTGNKHARQGAFARRAGLENVALGDDARHPQVSPVARAGSQTTNEPQLFLTSFCTTSSSVESDVMVWTRAPLVCKISRRVMANALCVEPSGLHRWEVRAGRTPDLRCCSRRCSAYRQMARHVKEFICYRGVISAVRSLRNCRSVVASCP